MSRKLRFFACRIVLSIFLQIHGVYPSKSKSVLERFKYLERRINAESKFRDEDFLDIIERLDEIDRKLNKTLQNRTITGGKTEEKVKIDYSEIVENLHSGYNRIRTAFSEEKYQNERIRRQIPNLENNLTSVKRDLQEYCSASVDKTESLRVNLKESIESVATNVENAVQKLSIKVKKSVESVRSEVADTLLDVTKRVESVESMVMNLTHIVQQIRVQTSTSNTCLGYRDLGNDKDGIYILRNKHEVYCDQTTDNGGWTVFQRRLNGAVDFYRTWDEYKTGFGDLNGEFWLGNGLLSMMTAGGDHELRVDMEDFEGNQAYAKYSKFRIHGEDDNYRLEVSGFSGKAGDSLAYHNGMPFTTSDVDNDESPGNCAQSYVGAWWYKRCHNSNLNGKYYNEAGKSASTGINWYHWKQGYYCLKTVEMKFR